MEYKHLPNEVKSPLRYPGGKSKIIDKILALIPDNVTEFSELFFGGGSISIALKQRVPNATFVVNDLYHPLMCFWKMVRDNPIELMTRIRDTRPLVDNAEKYKAWKQIAPTCTIETATWFFVINRCSFSGASDSGGYSQQAFEKRFTENSIQSIGKASVVVQDFQMYNADYMSLVSPSYFMILDPPYFSTTHSKLYGKNGSMHTPFNHADLATILHDCKTLWLLMIDDCPAIRLMYSWAHFHELDVQYGMNNVGKDHAPKGKELIITNY